MSLAPQPSLSSQFENLKQMSAYFPLHRLRQLRHADFLPSLHCHSQIGKVRQVSRCSRLNAIVDTPTPQYVFLGAYTMLLYDHLLTLPAEVWSISLSPGLSSVLILWHPIAAGPDCMEEEEIVSYVAFMAYQLHS